MAIQTPPIKKGKPGEDRMAQAQAAKRPPAVAPAPPKKPPVVNTVRPPLPVAAPKSDERRFNPPPKGKSTFKYTLPERRPIVPAPSMGRPMPVAPFRPNMVRPDLPAAPVNFRDPQSGGSPMPFYPQLPDDERRMMNLRPSITPRSVRDPQSGGSPTPFYPQLPTDERRMMDMRPTTFLEKHLSDRLPDRVKNLLATNDPGVIDGKGFDRGGGFSGEQLLFGNAGTSTFTPPRDEGKSGTEFDLPARVNAPGSVERQKNDRNSMIALAIAKIQASQGGNPLTPAQKAQAAAQVDVYIANRATTMGNRSEMEFDFSDFFGNIAGNAGLGALAGFDIGGTVGLLAGIPAGPPGMLATGGAGAGTGSVVGSIGGGIYGAGEYIADYLKTNYGTPYAAPYARESMSGDAATGLTNLASEYGLIGNPYAPGTPEHAGWNAARLESGRSVPASPDALQLITLEKQRQAAIRAEALRFAASGEMADKTTRGGKGIVEGPAGANYFANPTDAELGYMGDYQFNLLMLGVKNGQVPAASLYDTNLKLSPAQQQQVLAYLTNPVVTKPAGDAPPVGGLGGGLGGGAAVIPAGPAPTPGGEATAAGDGMSDFEKLAQLMEIGKYARAPVEPDRTRENELYALLQGSQGKQEALMQQYIEALIKQLNAQPQTGIPAVPAPATGVSSGNPFPLSGISQVARSGSNLQFSNAGLGYLNSIDPALLQALMQYLKAQQYTGMGQMGTYGELNYGRAGGTGALTMSDASFENPLNYAGLSTQMREPAEAGLRSLFAQMGLMG